LDTRVHDWKEIGEIGGHELFFQLMSKNHNGLWFKPLTSVKVNTGPTRTASLKQLNI